MDLGLLLSELRRFGDDLYKFDLDCITPKEDATPRLKGVASSRVNISRELFL